MSDLLLDTHIWAWVITSDARLSAEAERRVADADRVFISPISILEISQKASRGKWPELLPHVDELPDLIESRGGQIAPLTSNVCKLAGTLDWDHRDPFDRLLAATAIEQRLPILSVDKAFDALRGTPGWIARLW